MMIFLSFLALSLLIETSVYVQFALYARPQRRWKGKDTHHSNNNKEKKNDSSSFECVS